MADDGVYHEVVTEFLLNTCTVRKWVVFPDITSVCNCADIAAQHDDETEYIPLTTGSVAEFYIQPMLSCVGDVDIMFHLNDELAIPAGTAPPTQLPGEFHSRVRLHEITDSECAGYVYVLRSHLLTECIDDGMYNAVQCHRQCRTYGYETPGCECIVHGPAHMIEYSYDTPIPFGPFGRLDGTRYCKDRVYCVRCLSWPSQAADWPTRHRNYGWPDSATVDCVVSNGCDVIQVAHRRCRQDEWTCQTQWRLSFSRAEIVLLNSWIPVQQIVYHMLRVFVKAERLTDSANNSDVATLSNYHIKTLMLWACEMKPRSWWIDDLNVVRLSVELLHTLGDWLTDARCPHYFIHNCNLFDNPDNCYCEIASRLMSETEASLAEWFISNYITKCAEFRANDLSQMIDDISDWTLKKAVSAVVDCRLKNLMSMPQCNYDVGQNLIAEVASHRPMTLRSCLCWITSLAKIDDSLSIYFTAIAFLQAACKATHPLKDELLDILATTCLQSNHVRRCVNARRSSVLSLSQAAKLMKVVANNSHSTVQLIEIELSKAYLYRALRCKDSDSDSIYCLTNVYLAVLYYTTGQYQTVTDHCTLVTRSHDHSQCSSHFVQGELLPKIDDDIDTVLGLSVFYQYVRTAALNQQQQTQHVSVFTTELFAHYLHIRCLSVMKCHQLTQTSSTDKVQRYRKCLHELQAIFTTDVLIINFLNRRKCATNDQRRIVVSLQVAREASGQLDWDTSKLVELLQQSAVDHLTAFRQRQAQAVSPVGRIVTTDFEALYAYKCGEYQRCLRLSVQNVCTLIGVEELAGFIVYPEFIQLMDDDIVSLAGLALITDRSCRNAAGDGVKLDQLYLSLYLTAQCQMKLHHPVTSLARTLHYINVIRRDIGKGCSKCEGCRKWTFDRLLLNLTERKILLYLSTLLE